MNKYFLLLIALSAVSFINSEDYTIGDYYDYFYSVLAQTGTHLNCPLFFVNNKDKILEYYYDAAKQIVDGRVGYITETRADLISDVVYGNVGEKIVKLPEFRTSCEEIPLKKMNELLFYFDYETKKEINQNIFKFKWAKTLLKMNSDFELEKGRELHNMIARNLGHYISIILTIYENGTPVEILSRFEDYYKLELLKKMKKN